MIEIRKNELRIDETVLMYATEREMVLLHQICTDISRRVKKGEVTAK